ncbi:cilia- and flagella-associated protein 57-like [Daktulosphaira vitifoliae]|uniref:cilia- and flagella-associated protein 57-like n=1 Tax=Daktulosphaira vitifoliae TaxID=58002 RepID=UPI0021A9D514|nr:cilia- and flagella-associated protein 57-like [Daktulosphaira vitifoliae]
MTGFPKLQPKYFYGITVGLNGSDCLFFNDKELFNAFIRNVVALAERGGRPKVRIYDLESLKYKHTLEVPQKDKANGIINLKFSCDDIFLAVLTDGPDFMMYFYSWENSMIESSTQAIEPSTFIGPVLDMALNPSDSTIMCFVGSNLFRLMTITETVWKQYGFQTIKDVNFTSVCWLNGDRILAGTLDCRIFYIENGNLRAVYVANTIKYIDIKYNMENPLEVLASHSKTDQYRNVRCLTPINTGFLFIVGRNNIFYFAKENDDKIYSKRAEFAIEKDLGILEENISLQTVECLSINPSTQKLVCVTKMSQMYWTTLALTPDIILGSTVKLKPLGEDMHYGGIASLSTCQWKPIFLTCGKIDGTIKVWDYISQTLIFSQHYQENVFSVSVHPTGLYSLASFISKVEFQLIQMEGLKEWKKIAMMDCNLTAFSNSGHMFALANHHKVDVYCSVIFEHRYTLRGHSGIITALRWGFHDANLITCGLDGAIYEYNMRTGERDLDIVNPEIVYIDLVVSKDTSRMFPIAQDGRFREIYNQTVCIKKFSNLYLFRNVNIHKGNLNAAVLSNTDSMLFIAAEHGVVLSFALPIITKIQFNEFRMHNQNITKMCITMNDLFFITCSNDGSLCIWEVKNTEDKMIKVHSDFNYLDDILVTASDISDKIATIEQFEIRVAELERTYKVDQLKETNIRTIQDIRFMNSRIIDSMKKMMKDSTREHNLNIILLKQELNNLKESHENTIEKLESYHFENLLREYKKYTLLEDKMYKTTLELKKGLSEIKILQNQKLEELIEFFNERLTEKDKELHKIKENLIMEKNNTIMLMEQIEDDVDRDFLEKKTNYLTKIRELKKININLRGQLGTYKMKTITALEEIENLTNLIEKYDEDLEQLKTTVNEKKSIKYDISKQIKSRDEIIQEKNNILFEENLKLKELEKESDVLKHNIQDMEQAVEPLILELQAKKEAISDLENELDEKNIIIKRTELFLIEQREILQMLEVEIHKQQNIIRNSNNIISRMVSDIHQVSQKLQNPSILKSVVSKLYHQYAEEKSFNGTKYEELNSRIEFSRQRGYLEKLIASHRRKMKKCNKKSDSHYQIIEENMALIEEVKSLRKDVKNYRTKYNNLESLIKIEDKNVSPKQARAMLNSVISIDNVEEKYKDRLTTLQNRIEMLQSELNRVKNIAN